MFEVLKLQGGGWKICSKIKIKKFASIKIEARENYDTEGRGFFYHYGGMQEKRIKI